MFLSVIIPYFNGEKYIANCLDSLLIQDIDKEDYEVVVVDDGSTNNPAELLAYTRQYNNVRYLRQENSRQSAARNNGLRHSKGDYVFFCDCDDQIASNVLGKLKKIVAKYRPDVLCYHYIEQDEGQPLATPKCDFDSTSIYDTGFDYLNHNTQLGGPWDFLARREFLLQNTIWFDETMMMREDIKHYLCMMLAAERVMTVDAQVYYYIQRPTSVVHQLGKKQQNSLFIDNMIAFIEFFKAKLSELRRKGLILEATANVWGKKISEDAFICLHNTFRYGTIKRNFHVVKRIRALNIYPLSIDNTKWRKVVALMNKPSLWLFACVCFHIIPKSIRYKLF